MTSRIADLGNLRVFGALENIDATGLTATPAFDDAAREGDLVRMPDWSTWRGPTIAVAEPAALFLLAPASGVAPAASATASPLSETWRLVRRIQPGPVRP